MVHTNFLNNYIYLKTCCTNYTLAATRLPLITCTLTTCVHIHGVTLCTYGNTVIQICFLLTRPQQPPTSAAKVKFGNLPILKLFSICSYCLTTERIYISLIRFTANSGYLSNRLFFLLLIPQMD